MRYQNAHPDFAKRHILIFIAESDTPDPKPNPKFWRGKF